MKYLTAGLLASVCSIVATPAQAQTVPVPETEQEGPAPSTDPSEATQSGQAEDVILVTARRRAENIQDVPVAVTAVDGDALTQVGVRDGTDLVKVVPSLSVGLNAARRDIIVFELRGISAGDVLLPQDPGVAVYVNDFVHARPYGLQGALYDLESVQVLFGPQGTLFGRNSTAGAVLLNTKKPDTNGVSGEYRAAFGNYRRRELFGAINLPIGDKLAFRLAGDLKKRDGFTRNLTDGRDLDDRDQRAFRFSSLVKPVEGLTSVTVVDYYKSSDNGTGNKLLAVRQANTCDPQILQLTGICNFTGTFARIFGNATVNAAVADSLAIGPRQTRSNVDTFSDQKVTSIVNTTTLEVTDAITLKNIVGYLHYNLQSKTELDGSNIAALATSTFGEGDQWSNEFQVQGTFGTVDAILGAYYFNESGIDATYTNAFAPLPVGRGRLFNATTNVTEAEARNISKSLFGQATWRVTPALSLTAGARYTWDSRRINVLGRIPGSSTCLVFDRNNVRLPFNNCSRNESVKYSDPSYTLSVDYKVTEDILVYAAHRRGYRSGGFSPRGVNNATLIPFEPEKILDYELGFKSEVHFGDVLTRLNAAAFIADYSNIQRTKSILINNIAATSVVNATSAKVKGGEATLTIEPFEGLTLTANASYVDFEVGRFDDIVNNNLTTPVTLVPVTLRDLTFPVAKWQYGLNATYNRAVPGAGNLTAVFNYKWRDDSFGTLSFPFTDPEGFFPSYGTADASLRLSDIFETPLFVGAYVENLFDKTALAGGLTIQRTFGLTTGAYIPPRMYGVEFGAKF